MRVHELAKQLSLKSRELLDVCERIGIAVKSHASALDDESVEKLNAELTEGGATQQAESAEKLPEDKVVPPEVPVKAPVSPGNEALPVEDEDDIEEDADGNRDVPIPAKRKGGGQPRRSSPRQWGGLSEDDPFFQFGSPPETWGSTRKQPDRPRNTRPKTYLECTKCGVKIEKKRAHGGKKVRCPFCPRWMREVK